MRLDFDLPVAAGVEIGGELPLQGCTKKRRVLVLRRPSGEETVAMESGSETGQPVLTGMVGINKDRPVPEYAALVTSLPEGEVLTMAQMYRDRADAENVFDVWMNQWAWTGFTTHDLRRSPLMKRIVDLVFNGWSLPVRRAVPGRHTEATEAVLTHVGSFLTRFAARSEQLSRPQRWASLLRFHFQACYSDRVPRGLLATS